MSAVGRPSLPSHRLAALHQSSGEWVPFPTIPLFPQSLPLFCTLPASGIHLVVVCGWDPETLTCSDAVYVYSFLSATWSHDRPMPGPTRSFFTCAASPSNQVFIAEGHNEEKNALKSAMVYDIAKDDWTMLPEMARERDECTGVFEVNKAGLFRVVSGYCTSMQGRFERSAEAFDVGE
ncbi:hypothetical protein IEQ34_020919 [Dendrobium chrysotoxum]|uniref:F-box/kelch-repeat protein n=1 Tax=Dendrobium chrysotoxum TaxID=161865 RepID=A0AAV7G427_DENCH|nr:hypothetical protein IEQ34_020919 [Dendrobium chrysotoxum]